MEILEADSDLRLDGAGLLVHKGEAALNQRIRFWLEKIRQGDFWGKPDKGNSLHSYQFRSPSEFIFALLEMEIVENLPRQIPVRILSVRCMPAAAGDKYTHLQIVYQNPENGESGIFAEDILDNKA